MSALQEIAGNIEQYPKRIREAKEKKRYTISDIVDLSGVSKSAVSKLLDGSQMDPKLYNSVAMCMVLDLSLDELFGLDKPIDHPESMQARIHQLELENAHLSGNVKRLEEVNAIQKGQMRTRKPVIFVLIGMCAVMAMCLVAYLFIDSQITAQGLIRNGQPTTVAWFVIAVAVTAVIASSVIISMALRKKV